MPLNQITQHVGLMDTFANSQATARYWYTNKLIIL